MPKGHMQSSQFTIQCFPLSKLQWSFPLLFLLSLLLLPLLVWPQIPSACFPNIYTSNAVLIFKALWYFTAAPHIPHSSFSLKTHDFEVVYPKLLDCDNNFHRLGAKITSRTNTQRCFISTEAEKTTCLTIRYSKWKMESFFKARSKPR